MSMAFFALCGMKLNPAISIFADCCFFVVRLLHAGNSTNSPTSEIDLHIE